MSAIPDDYIGTHVVRGLDVFVFPLEASPDVFSKWPGVDRCGWRVEAFTPTLELMRAQNDLICDTDTAPTCSLPVVTIDGRTRRRRFVVVKESRTASDVARLGRIRRYDAARYRVD